MKGLSNPCRAEANLECPGMFGSRSKPFVVPNAAWSKPLPESYQDRPAKQKHQVQKAFGKAGDMANVEKIGEAKGRSGGPSERVKVRPRLDQMHHS